jgi:RHS repeat-associated protein
VTSGTLTTTFEYDGLPVPVAPRPGTGQAQVGNRTAQTVGGVTTEYVLDVAGGLPEVIVATRGEASTRYVQVQGQILAEHEAGAWGYVLPDALGSVRQVIDAAGQVTLAQSYDPFGASFETFGSGESDFGYTGESWDAEAALLYLRARYYEPAIGRFVSKDPWQGDSSRPQSLNAWSYVQGNPLNFTDPSGRIFCPYGVNPETGTCNPPRWGGRGEGLPPAFAQTAAVDPASATAQVALSVLAYLYFRLADNLQPSPPPLRVGSPREGLREWLPLGQQPSSLIPGPALGDTPEWLPAVLPGPYVDMPGTTTWLLDFRLVQPCFEDGIILASAQGDIRFINPGTLRWTQRTAGGRGRAAQLRQSMLEKGWDGPPIDVVETADGLVTVDHTRAAIALELGMDRIPARIHQPDEPLPVDMIRRARFKAADGTVAKTWGEAIAIRAGRQRPPLPSTGTEQVPRLP